MSGTAYKFGGTNGSYIVANGGYEARRCAYKHYCSWDKPLSDKDVKELYNMGYGTDASAIQPSALRLWYPLGALDGSADFSAGPASDSTASTLTFAINRAASVHTDSSGYGTFMNWTETNNLHTVQGRAALTDSIRTDSPRSTETPLYNFADINKHPEFKLLAKKVFMPGGLKLPDNSDHNDYITIEWTLKF